MSILSIRVEEKVKAKAMKILRKKGLDVSTAVNMYLREIIDADDAPCELCRKYLPKDTGPSSDKIRARLARESAEAVKGPSFRSFKALANDAWSNTKPNRARTDKN